MPVAFQRLPTAIDRFFFAPMDARGLRLMRVLWAATVFAVMLKFAPRVAFLFAEPKTTGQTILHYPGAWSVLFWFTSPTAVTALYIVLLVACVYMMLGCWIRPATLVAVVLFASFTQRNVEVFHSEAILLRVFGFILLLCCTLPGYVAPARWLAPSTHRHLSVPAWPYRVLLWQVIVLYVAAGWHKAISPLWTSGEAVQGILHWEYSRLTAAQADLFQPASFVLSYATMLWEFSWAVLLIPFAYWPWGRMMALQGWGKRTLILLGVLMHAAWALLLNNDIYPLSLAMFAAYCGLLTADDWAAVRRAWHRRRFVQSH